MPIIPSFLFAGAKTQWPRRIGAACEHSNNKKAARVARLW
jgi:hypothetical protein